MRQVSQNFGGRIPAGSPPLSVANRVRQAERRVIAKAVDVIGDRSEALRWLGTPVRALGYATPVSRFDTLEHIESVDAVLDRLAHGVL